MEAYSAFAQVYDELMDNVPYESWCEGICSLLAGYGIKDGLILDLGCGTGNMTRLLSKRGFDMTGVDSSVDMLSIARDKGDDGILYLQQDMRELELYGTVKAVICVCDSINYILDAEDIKKVFSLVNNYLDPGGIFIFDMNTLHKYRDVLSDSVISEDRDDVSFIWENSFYEEEMLNEYDLTLFIRRDDGLYEKTQEVHAQRAYRTEEMKSLIKESGLELLGVLGEDMRSDPGPVDERVYFIARERGKTL